MDCEKCGASVDEGAEKCPECGEPTGSHANDLLAREAAPEAPAAPVATGPAEPSVGTQPGGNRMMMIVAGAVAIVLVALGVWFVTGRVSAANSPEAAAKSMMTAYAEYDAKGILDVSTHTSLKAADITTFEKQAADAKQRAGGKPGVKDITIGKVTASSPTTVTVEVTGQWLADPTKGTYEKRTEKLTVVKPDGKWLVLLF